MGPPRPCRHWSLAPESTTVAPAPSRTCCRISLLDGIALERSLRTPVRLTAILSLRYFTELQEHVACFAATHCANAGGA